MATRSHNRHVLTGAGIGLLIAAGLLALGLLAVVLTPVLGSANSMNNPLQTTSSAADLRPGQLDNARTIIAVGRGHQVDDAAIKIALMTALQESSLRNLPYGDRDSLGLFQQRPSQGWGTPAQITDPIFATRSFFGVNPQVKNPGLNQITGWRQMAPTDAAQAVQRSAYPKAYARWEKIASELLRSHTDVSPIN